MGAFEDAALAALVVDTEGDEVGGAEADLIGFDDRGAPDIAGRPPEERGHAAIGANELAVQVSLVDIVDGLHGEQETAAAPRCWDLHDTAIPGEAVVGVALRFPVSGYADGLPGAGAQEGKRLGSERESEKCSAEKGDKRDAHEGKGKGGAKRGRAQSTGGLAG